MITVSKKDYDAVKKKIKEAPTFVSSVLDHIIKGTVYSNSTSFDNLIIQTNSGLHYVTGVMPDYSFFENIVRIFEDSVMKGRRFTLFSNRGNWDRLIEENLGERLKKIERYSFSFDLNTFLNRKGSLNHSYNLEKINESHLKNCLEFDKQYYDEYWDSVSNFIQNGFGFCVIENNQIISEAVSIFRSIDYAEVDIITDSNYRGKGLASIVAVQFIEYCRSHNIQPRWDCDINNNASIQLANKLGFNNPQKYQAYGRK